MRNFITTLLFLVSTIASATGTVQKQPAEVLECKLPENKMYRNEQQQIYTLIEKQVHFLRAQLHSWKQDPSMKLITGSKSWENYIRPNCTFAADLSFLLRFGNFDSTLVGAGRTKVLNEELIPVLRYLIRTHLTGDLKTDDGKSWGKMWQSAHWTSALGNAAWWSWENLPVDIKEGVRRVVGYEADRIQKIEPPHQLKLDSKSEENAWNSQVLSSAIILMPDDSRRDKWEMALRRWSMSAYLRPADSLSTEMADGIPVCKQYTGANIHNDFTLENHDIVHPDYMGAWIMNAGNDLDYLLTGRKPYQAFLYNLSNVYQAQRYFLMPDAGYCYPNGQDWALFRNSDWIPSHATALVRFNDAHALFYLRKAIEIAQKMQNRNPDGAIYAPGENYFASSQPHLAYWMVQAWLVLHFAEHEVTPLMNEDNGVRCLNEAKILLNRAPKSIQTVSWGEKVMIQLMAMSEDHIVSPDQRNGIGTISVNDTILSVSVKDVRMNVTGTDFKVAMTVYHGKYVSAKIVCQSLPNGQLKIRETLTALKSCSTDNINTLSFGILNNPNWVCERGERKISDGKLTEIAKSASGVPYSFNTSKISVDSMTFNLGKSASVRYLTASRIENSRFTDLLILNSVPAKKQWKQGERISTKQVIISLK